MPIWEKALIGLFLAIAVPITLLVAGWWGAATLSMSRIYPLADEGIAMAAWTGLALGVALVAWRLPRWIQAFYAVPVGLAIPLYLFWTAIATAWFMGLPFGNLALGAFAGAYMGRRLVYHHQPPTGLDRTVAVRALFPAGMTALAALGIGLLAMREPYILAFARQALSTARFMSDSAADAALVAIAVTGLFVLQYGVTWAAARAAIRLPRLPLEEGRPTQPAGLVNLG